jgi:AAA family ATP:ADP antiporter
MSAPEAVTADRPFIARLLRVEPGELPALAWSFLYFFALLCGYYVLRPVRDEMGIQAGVRNIPWLMSATFLAMLAVTPVFGWLAARFPRRVMLPAVYLFFILNLVGFRIAFDSGADPKVVASTFYVWLSVFNLFVVSVFWSFMADLFAEGQAKRLFPVIAAGGSLGAVTGPVLVQWLVEPLGKANLMLVSAAFLGLAIGCIVALGRTARARGAAGDAAAAAAERPLGGTVLAGVRLVLQSPYLLGICLYILVLTWSSVLLYLEQARIVSETIGSSVERTRLFARIDLAVNVCTLLCQFFLTNRLIERLGLTAGLVLLPLASIAGFLGMAWAPVLPVLVGFAIVRRVGEYAIAKPTREVLFTVLDRESKYKAKNFVDTAVARGGDAVSGWFVEGLKALGATGAHLALVAVPVMAAWGGLGVWLARRHEAMVTPAPGPVPAAPSATASAAGALR